MKLLDADGDQTVFVSLTLHTWDEHRQNGWAILRSQKPAFSHYWNMFQPI